MATKKSDRLAPPLMHAFRVAHDERDATPRTEINRDGEKVIVSRRVTVRAPISEMELRRVVNSDLLALLNTTTLAAAEDLSDAPEVRKSILNFGFPELAWRTIDDNGLTEIAAEIETALADFEPRFTRKSIKARRDSVVKAGDLRLRFLVKAELRAQPVNVQMEFVAEVELDTGKIKIDRL
jgi:type VI secretion system protein ImpF